MTDSKTAVFRVVSVKKSPAPEGMSGSNWHCYIIESRNSAVTGKMAGTLRQVTDHAEQVARDLNARSGLQSGSLYAARRSR